MRWPTRRMNLWNPQSPGGRVVVNVRWPRYLWRSDHGFATCQEVIRAYQSHLDMIRFAVDAARRAGLLTEEVRCPKCGAPTIGPVHVFAGIASFYCAQTCVHDTIAVKSFRRSAGHP